MADEREKANGMGREDHPDEPTRENSSWASEQELVSSSLVEEVLPPLPYRCHFVRVAEECPPHPCYSPVREKQIVFFFALFFFLLIFALPFMLHVVVRTGNLPR